MDRGRTSEDREARLAEALRANLRKRKAQGKSRDVASENVQDQPETSDKTGIRD